MSPFHSDHFSVQASFYLEFVFVLFFLLALESQESNSLYTVHVMYKRNKYGDLKLGLRQSDGGETYDQCVNKENPLKLKAT